MRLSSCPGLLAGLAGLAGLASPEKAKNAPPPKGGVSGLDAATQLSAIGIVTDATSVQTGGGAAAPSDEKTLRQTAGPLRLLLTALGGPREIWGKFVRIWRTILLLLNSKKIDQRLTALHERGYIDSRPGRAQIMFGGFDMLRFMIAPGARNYYDARGISFGLHQVLRVLDDPVSMIDPTGFLSDRDTIVGHVMQVVHLN